jgi:hypothetical protein
VNSRLEPAGGWRGGGQGAGRLLEVFDTAWTAVVCQPVEAAVFPATSAGGDTGALERFAVRHSYPCGSSLVEQPLAEIQDIQYGCTPSPCSVCPLRAIKQIRNLNVSSL